MNFIIKFFREITFDIFSAAHCMQQKNVKTASQDIVVKVGVYNVKDWGDDITQTRTLAAAAIHDRYNSSSLASELVVFLSASL